MKRILIIAIVAVGFSACVEPTDHEFDRDQFTSIFDHPSFSEERYALDVRETADGRFLVLGERRVPNSLFRSVFIILTDSAGKPVQELLVDEPYVGAVGNLMEQGGQYYFFCMDYQTVRTHLAVVDVASASVTVSPIAAGLTYPAASAVDGNAFLLMSYDHEGKQTLLSIIDKDGNLTRPPVGFGIGAGDEVEEPIINHFLRTGKRFPFQVGKVNNGLYFFNGFYNYTFSLVFTDLSQINGVVQGQQDDGGVSALFPLNGNQFAASRFNFGDNYFLPVVALETNGLSSTVDLGGKVLPELNRDAEVRISALEANGSDFLVFAADTKSRQVGLYFYERTSGVFRNSTYLGFSNPFEIGGMAPTEDGGLAVAGTTYLAGRFARPFLIKLSPSQLAELLQ